LPAGKLSGVGIGFVAQPHQCEHFVHAFGLPGRINTGDLQREGHIAGHRPRAEQVEVLEDHADALSGLAQVGG
jgi:hypothetical protein